MYTPALGRPFNLYRKGNDTLLSSNALTILEARYLRRDADGNICETPDEMFRRVADAVDMGEGYADAYYDMMRRLDFLPNSPTLMNAGTGMGTLSACFVLPLEDTMEGIMDAAKDQALVQKFGGGTGFSLSKLRPRGDSIQTTHGVACGPVAVLQHLSSVSKLVTQGGKRDGANMAVLSISHPDVEEFIDCKRNEGDIHNFNISVGVSDEFMRAVRDDALWELVNPRNGETTKILPARELWDKIVAGAWLNGEPGVIFLDTVNREHRAMGLPDMTATNPCGEQPLLPNESCNLGSINLANFVAPSVLGRPSFDWGYLDLIVRRAVRFLDNVIDVNVYATPAIEKGTKATRKIGLGVMGWADALLKLGIPYDSIEARVLAEDVFAFIRSKADDESEQLGLEKGVAPALDTRKTASGWGKRNACVLTVAPTGTISMIAECSSGIEPVFALGFVKKNILATRGDGPRQLRYINAEFEQVAKDSGFWSEDLMEHVAQGGSIRERADVPDAVKKIFVTAGDIAPSDHVLMQAAFQRHCDSGISKTINLPNQAQLRDVADAYMLAWTNGCKGITVYRSGSRMAEVLAVEAKDVVSTQLMHDALFGESKPDSAKSPILATAGYAPEMQAIPVQGTFDIEEFDAALADGVIDELAVMSVPSGAADNLTHATEECSGPVVREEGCLKCYACGVSAC